MEKIFAAAAQHGAELLQALLRAPPTQPAALRRRSNDKGRLAVGEPHRRSPACVCTICTPNEGPEHLARHITATFLQTDLTLGQDLTLPGHACVSRTLLGSVVLLLYTV